MSEYININLWPFQYEIFKDVHRYRVVAAGRRCGKTHVTASIGFVYAVNNSKCRVLFIGQTHENIKEAVYTTLKGMIPESYIKKVNESTREITLLNGSKLSLKTSDNPQALRGMSPSPSMIILDEFAFHKLGVYESVIRPMSLNKNVKFIFISTPLFAHDQFREFYDRGQDDTGQYEDWASWQFKTAEVRPDLREEIEQLRKEMDPLIFRREFEASFETTSNAVFYNFDFGNHTFDIDPGNAFHNILDNETLHIAIDFNVRKMASTVSVIRNINNVEKVLVMDEFYGAANTQALCDDIKMKYPAHINNIITYPDPAGKANKTNAPAGKTDLAILEQNGFIVRARDKHPTQQDSANAVNRMLLNGSDSSAGTSHRFFINKKCTGTVDSMLSTVWKDTVDGDTKKIDKTGDKEHFSDGIRYMIEYLYPIEQYVEPHYVESNWW